MNEKTKQRLESDLNVPSPTQPVDNLRLDEAPAAAAPGPRPATIQKCGEACVYVYDCEPCFADDE